MKSFGKTLMPIKPYALLLGLALTISLAVARPIAAQEQVWLQIEAQPTLEKAEERARAYGGAFPNVAGFRLSSGWYAIVLGPYAAGEADQALRSLKQDRLVPGDAYLAEGNSFRDAFWPPGGDPAGQAAAGVAPAEPVEVTPLAEPAEPATDPILDTAAPAADPAADPAPAQPAFVDETPAQAKASEATLSRTGREDLQTALQWFGFYEGKIDGAFGPGTRKSMAAWQAANGFEATGVLTSFQRDTLQDAYRLAQAALGIETVTEAEAGIRIDLPMALVAFDHYEPPFVHFVPKDGSGVSVILISQPGDQSSLYGLYDVLQTLAIMPVSGERERRERSFTIKGRNGKVESHAYAELSKGLIKGYILSWDPARSEGMDRVLAAMQNSFAPVGDRALDPGLVPLTDEVRAGLLAGLEVRRPKLSRSGFYVDASGLVLTTQEAVAGCGRITIDRDNEARVAHADEATGVVLIKPVKPLAPVSVAELTAASGRQGSEIAVAGYPYEDLLPSAHADLRHAGRRNRP
jgi:peptidoglycan hydrolase-like protein with peptidoglycan-binding domain